MFIKLVYIMFETKLNGLNKTNTPTNALNRLWIDFTWTFHIYGTSHEVLLPQRWIHGEKWHRGIKRERNYLLYSITNQTQYTAYAVNILCE